MRGLRKELNLLEDSDFGIVNKKEINNMADFVKNNNGKKNNKKSNSRPNKVKDYGSRKDSIITPPDVCGGLIEYKMPAAMAEDILKNDKTRKAPQEVLCEYVNSQLGLLGYCVKVLVS